MVRHNMVQRRLDGTDMDGQHLVGRNVEREHLVRQHVDRHGVVWPHVVLRRPRSVCLHRRLISRAKVNP
jgi:hypothetical protein